MDPVAPAPAAPAPPPNIRELVITLFELGREITAVLNLDELLQKIPQLIARLTKFHAFAVYLLDPRRDELTIAFNLALGYLFAKLTIVSGSERPAESSQPAVPK